MKMKKIVLLILVMLAASGIFIAQQASAFTTHEKPGDTSSPANSAYQSQFKFFDGYFWNMLQHLFTPTDPSTPAQISTFGNGKIAFQSVRDGNNEIYVLEADG